MSPGLTLLPGKTGPYLQTARELEQRGEAAEIYNESWELQWASSELLEILGNPASEEVGYGEHILRLFGREPWRSRVSEESSLEALRGAMPYYLHRDPHCREMLPPEVRQTVSDIEPREPPPLWTVGLEIEQEGLPPLPASCFVFAFREGDFSGFLRLYVAGMPASLLALVARGSEDMFQRMSRLVEPGRHPVAILFSDIEGSTELARTLPSAVYFELVSSLAKATDNIVGRHDGIVGKHAGDGSSAFFLADDHGKTSAAVRAAIVSDREIKQAAEEVGERIAQKYDLPDLRLAVNSGLHWGATVYMGQIVSGGRLEVSALGDEVNECARLEGATREGRTLASKTFLERLSEEDARELGIHLLRQNYFPLREIELADNKSLRDIGSLPVCYVP